MTSRFLSTALLKAPFPTNNCHTIFRKCHFASAAVSLKAKGRKTREDKPKWTKFQSRGLLTDTVQNQFGNLSLSIRDDKSSVKMGSSSGVKIEYQARSDPTDPNDVPVTIVGLASHLAGLQYGDVEHKLGGRVSEGEWKAALEELKSSSDSQIYVYSNKVVMAKLPVACSRHNAPSRPFAITKLAKARTAAISGKSGESFILVCNRSEVYASGCALARAYSLYSRKTVSGSLPSSATSDSASDTSSPQKVVTVEFICPNTGGGDASSLTDSDLTVLQAASHGIRTAARIVDTPCNEMHTDAFIDEVRKVADSLKAKPPLVIQGEELREKGFGGIYGVGKAAVHQPALVVLSHEPKGATQTVAWVGKGIVYDTGGLSIKGKTQMPGMKRDCGGAAGILGAFYAAVKQGFSQNLHAIFCLAENAVGDRATRPDDIHTLYSGKTVEINNTDAEGRLVVSDGVVYANKDLKADVILDMCTLTGAQGIATGRTHAAHLTNCPDWEAKTHRAGRASGDLSFPVVYCPELHYPEFYSAVADMKNSVADRNNAQPSCAGLFINAHLGFDFPGAWVHVDMAAPAYSGERGTGYGVALLNVLFGEHVDSSLLKNAAASAADDSDQSKENGSTAKKMRLQ